MRNPFSKSRELGLQFQEVITEFLEREKLVDSIANTIGSKRYLSRSLVPHILRLSGIFNRDEVKAEIIPHEDFSRPTPNPANPPRSSSHRDLGLQKYWKQTSHVANLRLAYFLYFMPANLVRISAIWTELSRLGFQWGLNLDRAKNNRTGKPLRAIEVGAGSAAGASGVAVGEKFAPLGLPENTVWALLDQEKSILDLGAQWSKHFFDHLNFRNWDVKTFHRELKMTGSLLPEGAPRFHLWIMSYFLNELGDSSADIAKALLKTWRAHLAEEGLILIAEPALKDQSRKLLDLRAQILHLKDKAGLADLQILLPCLGHQNCGALENPEDWCHEETDWWRPPYYAALDNLVRLDHKTLPFSYLVLIKSKRKREEILASLGPCGVSHHRLVSPPYQPSPSKRILQFYLCGQEGKVKAQLNVKQNKVDKPIERGSILTEIQGETTKDGHRSLFKISSFGDILN